MTKVVKKFRITNVSDLPPYYFFRAGVKKALYRELKKDLKRLKRTPSGVEAVYRDPNLFEKVIQKARSLHATRRTKA